VHQTVDDLADEELHVIFVDLPLDDPATPEATPQLREAGFVLAGLMPLFHQERDYLRLQRPLVPLDLDLIQTHSDRSHAIKQIIKEELACTMSDLKTG